MYEKQTFYSGQPLQASQLNTMEDGIIVAQEIAQDAKDFSERVHADVDNLNKAAASAESLADEAKTVAEEAKTTSENAQAVAEGIKNNAANMQVGTGITATQQTPREDKVHDTDGKQCFTISEDMSKKAGIGTEVEYGATGNYSATLCGRSSAQNKHSFAIGNSTVALGEESFAQGYTSIAKGNSSFAGGSQTYAEGEASVTLGGETHASGVYSMAQGQLSKASGESSYATGINTHAEGKASITGGDGSHAKGIASVALGFNTNTEGDYAIATGANTKAKGDCASANGYKTQANGEYSSTFGTQTVANELSQTVVGQYNDPAVIKENFHSIFQIGCGSTNDTRMNALNVSEGGEMIIRWNGGYYSLESIFNLINNYLNSLIQTTDVNYFEDARVG